MKVSADIVFDGALAVKKSDQRDMLKRQWVVVGELWHTKYRPQHFEESALQRYPEYKPRARGYNQRKRKKLHHARPLVKSGRSVQLSEAVSRIAPTINSVTIAMPIKAINFKPKGSSINMLEEFRAVSPAEDRSFERTIVRGIETELRTFSKKTRKKIK